jgi:ribosome-binding protein aMBF1 (putative translation factor)
VLLALEGFSKKTQKTRPEKIRLAERRLADWRRRGQGSISAMRCHLRYSGRMTNRRDFLDEIIGERSERNPEFPDLVEAALRRRQLLRELATRREKLGLSQTLVAARMGTSQSAVARLEASEIDAKFSTVERFAAALGQKVEWRVAKAR